MKNNKILITGSDGFLGKALYQRLISAGEHNIELFDIKNGSIEDYDFSNYNANHVFHFAARTFVPQSWEESYDYYKVNFLGTINILEYCRKNNTSMTFLSTYMYGTPDYLPIDEKHPRKANSIYHHSKLLAEDACEFYSKQFNIPITILRLFNVYGQEQRKDFLIPTIIQKALYDDVIEILDTKPKRDFIYIDDVIDAIILSTENTGFNIYNVGSGISYSVLEVANKICNALEINKDIIDKKQIRMNEINDVIADISKIKSELGWTPKITIDDGIKKIINSMKE